MMTERIPIPRTPRIERMERAWARSVKPADIIHPGPDQESVWDYPRPPAVERVRQRVEVFLGDVRVADSRRALRVLETASPPTIYIPPVDVRRDLLVPERAATMCEWKGAARYYSVRAGDAFAHRAAWCYPEPLEEYDLLAGYLSFYPGRMTRCLYGGEAVRPQPGSFYGGWVTSNLVGPFKGEPGSAGW